MSQFAFKEIEGRGVEGEGKDALVAVLVGAKLRGNLHVGISLGLSPELLNDLTCVPGR